MTQQNIRPASPIRDAVQLAGLAVDLQDKIDQLTNQLKTTKSQLDELLGVGDHAPGGIPVKVQPPNRRFNAVKAWDLLTPEQQALAQSPDPKKVKAQLPPVLADSCMEPGTGNNIVKVG